MQYSKNYKIPKPELNDTVNITNIHEIIDKFDTLTKDVDINCSNIKTNEDTRVSNENKRIEAESIRTSSESDRNSNEQLRKADELNRVNKETKRISDEQIRVSNEQNRISAESDRVLKENERLTNEQTRQENETTRTTNESKRVTNESYREETFKRMEEIFDLKAPGDMSKVEYDKDNDGIIDEAKHALEADKATESTHALSSDVSNSVEWNNVQNRPDVAKIEEQLKDNTTKTITKETNMLNLENNVEGIANISLEGNTINIAKEPIISDFKGKEKGVTSVNPNIVKYDYGKVLITPSSFTNEVNSDYTKISTINNDCATVTALSNTLLIPQQLFSFNIIEIVERKLNMSIGSNITEKVAWLKKNVTRINCNWYGYGTCPSGNIAKFNVWRSTVKSWTSFPTVETKSNVPAQISRGLYFQYTDRETIDTNGFIHFLAYTDASDCVVTSVIYTDYINLEVQLNPILKSVGEQENNKMEVKSVGKNLFNKNLLVTSSLINQFNGEPMTNHEGYIASNFIRIKPNCSYFISKNESPNTVLYDENKKFIKAVYGKDISFITTENSYYIRISCKQTELDLLQLEEGTTATPYEPYQEDKAIINIKEPLRGLPNSVRDTINADGTITRRVGKIVLNGSENNWQLVVDNDKNKEHIYIKLDSYGKGGHGQFLLCDKFEAVTTAWQNSSHGTVQTSNNNYFQIGFTFNKGTYTVESFKKWLSENPTTIYYELAKPITETINQPLTLQSFTNGTIQVDTEVTPFIIVKYPSNINSRINTVEDATSSIKDNLGGAWQTLLILADKELKMKSITPLSTSDDISKKINEIIGVW